MQSDEHDDFYSDSVATFGDRLTAAREVRGLSSKELAQMLGLKKKTVVAWESDMSEPRANKLQMLAGMLNVSMVWLMTGQGAGVEPQTADETSPERTNDALSELKSLRLALTRAVSRIEALEKRLRSAD